MASRKDYQGIAHAISQANNCLIDYADVPEVHNFWQDFTSVLMMELCAYFEEDNSLFKSEKFTEACEL